MSFAVIIGGIFASLALLALLFVWGLYAIVKDDDAKHS
jgi:hypothetical protein